MNEVTQHLPVGNYDTFEYTIVACMLWNVTQLAVLATKPQMLRPGLSGAL